MSVTLHLTYIKCVGILQDFLKTLIFYSQLFDETPKFSILYFYFCICIYVYTCLYISKHKFIYVYTHIFNLLIKALSNFIVFRLFSWIYEIIKTIEIMDIVNNGNCIVKHSKYGFFHSVYGESLKILLFIHMEHLTSKHY